MSDLFIQTNADAGGISLCDFLNQKGFTSCDILLGSKLSKSSVDDFVFVVAVSASQLQIVVYEGEHPVCAQPFGDIGKWVLKGPAIPFAGSIDKVDQVALDTGLSSRLSCQSGSLGF